MRMNKHEPIKSTEGESRLATMAVLFVYCMFGLMFFVGVSGCAVQQPIQKTPQQVEAEVAIEIGRSCLQHGYFYIDELVFLCRLAPEGDAI